MKRFSAGSILPKRFPGLTWLALLLDAGKRFIADNVVRMSAALAFYSALSLAPLLVLVLAIAGAAWNEQAAQTELIDQIRFLIGEQAAVVAQTVIEQADDPRRNTVAGVIGVLTLLLAGTAVFAQLQDALNTIWRVKPKPLKATLWLLVRKRLLSLGLVIAIAFLLLVSLVLSAAVNFAMARTQVDLAGDDPFWTLLNLAISLVVYVAVFAIMFRFLPDAKVSWRSAAVSAALTAALFAIGKELIGMFLGRGSVGSAYGAAGSLVVVLLWVYYSSLIVFFGAEFAKVYSERRREPQEPEEIAEIDESRT